MSFSTHLKSENGVFTILWKAKKSEIRLKSELSYVSLHHHHHYDDFYHYYYYYYYHCTFWESNSSKIKVQRQKDFFLFHMKNCLISSCSSRTHLHLMSQDGGWELLYLAPGLLLSPPGGVIKPCCQLPPLELQLLFHLPDPSPEIRADRLQPPTFLLKFCILGPLNSQMEQKMSVYTYLLILTAGPHVPATSYLDITIIWPQSCSVCCLL